MGDYNLNGLNPREFEHLVQAPALAVIAPGVTPFGDGPDGGREAIFRGRMAYPSVADPWEGYLVIQAKFRQRPAGDPHKDDAWLLDHLKADLDKFVDPKRKLPRPDYYLLVTNVVLTPVQDSGSKDRALALLAQRQTEIGYRGYSIWDYDHLRSLLDGQEAIRTRYQPFIGTGDVLAEVMRQLQGQRPDFELIVSRFLQVELRTDLYSRLEQAGHTSDDRIPLARVFVDLPAADNPRVNPPKDDDMQPRPGPGLLADLLQHASQILKPSVCASEVPRIEAHGKRGPEPGRFVVVGGPGQGKSTLGQFLCQLYRAAILKDQPRTRISRATQDALDLFVAQCRAATITAMEQRGIEPYIAVGREPHHQHCSAYGAQPLAPPPEETSPLVKMAYKLRTEIGQALYRLRTCTVEPVIGSIKEVLGFRQFSLRGLTAAAGDWCLVCLAFNLKRLPVLLAD